MSRNLGWIAVSVLLVNSWLSLSYASYAQSAKCSKCLTKSALRVTTASQDTVSNTFRLSTQQFVAAPTTQLFAGEAGKTIMTLDFPGILWDKPTQVIYPPNEEIEAVRLSQFQCDPPIFRVSITTSNKAILSKIAVDAHSGTVVLKFPPPSPKKVVPLTAAAKKEEYIKPVTQKQSCNNLGAGGLFLNLQKHPVGASAGAMAIASNWRNPYSGSGGPGTRPFISQGGPPQAQLPFNQNPGQTQGGGGAGTGTSNGGSSAPVPGSSSGTPGQSQTSGGTITGSQLMPPPQGGDPALPQNGQPNQQNQSRWSRVFVPAAVGGAAGATTAALWPRRSGQTQTIIAGGYPGYGSPPVVSIPSGAPGLPGSAPSITTTTTTTINRTTVNRSTINRTTNITSTPAITTPGQLSPSYQNVNYYPASGPSTPTIITTASPGSGNSVGSILAGTGAGIAAGAATGYFMHRNPPAYPPQAPQGLVQQAPTYPPSAPPTYNPAITTSGPTAGSPSPLLQDPLDPISSGTPVPLSAGPAQKLPPLAPTARTQAAVPSGGQLMGGDKNLGGIYGLGGANKNNDPFVSVSGSQSQKVIIRFNPNYSSYKTFRLEDPPRYVVDIDNGPSYWDISEAENTVNTWLSGVRIGHPDDAGTVTRVVLDLTKQKVALFENLDRTRGWLNITLQEPASETYIASGKVVVLDAGHGGSDPGAQRGDVQEKELTLSITKKLEKYFQAHGIKTVMTRSEDTFVSLEERVRITNNIVPNAFVSIHINSLETNSSIHGIETYYQTEQSRPLADRIHQSLVSGLTAPDRSVRKARFYVVNHTPVPAILAEVGFISNKEERDKLISSEYQSMIAESVGQGVMLYLSSLSTDGNYPTAAPVPGTEAMSAGPLQAISVSKPIKMAVPSVIIVPKAPAFRKAPDSKKLPASTSKTPAKKLKTGPATIAKSSTKKSKKHSNILSSSRKSKKLASSPPKRYRRSHAKEIAAIGS